MASNKPKVDASKLERALMAAKEAIGKPEMMRKYGEQVAGMIKLRTRLGQGVASDGSDKEGLKRLSPGYKAQRARDQAKGRLSDQTSPGKSNLTRTGQLLDSTAVQSVGQGRVKVGPTGTRNDPGRKEQLSNAQVAGFQEKQGRPYNHMSRVEMKRVKDQISKDLKAEMKRRLTTAKK